MRVVPALRHCDNGKSGEELRLDDERDVDILDNEVGSLRNRAADPDEEEPSGEAIGVFGSIGFDDLRYELE